MSQYSRYHPMPATLAYLVTLVAIMASTGCRTAAPLSTTRVASLDENPVFTELSATQISSAGQYEAMSEPAIGILKAGRAMKFFVDNRDPQAPRVYFVNANYKVQGEKPEYAKYHFNFSKHLLNLPEELKEFNAVTYFTENKRYMAGVVHTYQVGNEQVYGVQFYPQDVIHGAAAVSVTKLVAAQISIPGAIFAFVETGNQQASGDADAAFAAAGLRRLSLEAILGSVNYIAMNTGEAYGYLRIFPQNQDNIAASDIVVFDELPLDLTVVAGVLTKAFQDTNSHINLKSKERNTPNAILRDASPTHPDLAPFDGKPVHMVVGNDGFKLEATTPELVAQKLAERFNRPWIPIQWDMTSTLASYDDMCPQSPSACIAKARLYGSKAAMLGFLANSQVLGRLRQPGTMSQQLGYDLVPKGFGIPLQLYREFIDYPPNQALRDKLNDLITKEKANALTSAQRVALSLAVQDLFYKAAFPPDHLRSIKARVAADLPGISKIKVRSSANAEDIDGFDGAGLHDSYSAKPDTDDKPDGSCKREEDESEDGGETKAKMKPRSIACAMKGVYASLWNKRAIEERSFSRVDHATVSMGLSILPAYDYESEIAANSVVVTRVINSNDVFGYSLSIQRGNNLVTNPNPGTHSEVSVAAIGFGSEPTTLTVTRFAKPTKAEEPLKTTVMTKDATLQMVAVAQTVEAAYCRAKPTFYNDDCRFIAIDAAKEKSLDMEFKVLANGHLVCKQAREFSGR